VTLKHYRGADTHKTLLSVPYADPKTLSSFKKMSENYYIIYKMLFILALYCMQLY